MDILSGPSYDPVPTDTTVLAIIACFLAWLTMYVSLFFHLGDKKGAEWCCRFVTTVHAITVVAMSAWCGFVQGPWPFTHPGGPNTPLQHWTVTVSFAYFIFDFGWCLYFQSEGGVMLFHHLLSILGQALCLSRGKYGTEMIATIFGTEITNPLLQMRWFLRNNGRDKTWYYELNQIAFIITFGVFRIGLASYLLYTYLHHPRPDLIGKIGGIAIYSVGWVFWIAIVKYAIKRIRKISAEKNALKRCDVKEKTLKRNDTITSLYYLNPWSAESTSSLQNGVHKRHTNSR